MNKITVLITMFNISYEQALSKLEKMNIQSDFIVRNQTSFESNNFDISINGYVGKILCVNNETGASKNRNELLKLATSKYVIFADDDVIFKNNSIKPLIDYLESNDCDAVKFLVELPNKIGRNAPKNKPIKRKRVRYYDCTDAGPWSFCFKREFLVNNSLLFPENIGPGATTIRAGEDVLFIKKAFEKRIKMRPYNQIISSVIQEESTWFTGFDENQLITEGGCYYLLYKPFHHLFYLRHYLRFKDQYKLSLVKCFKIMNEGKRIAKRIEKEEKDGKNI